MCSKSIYILSHIYYITHQQKKCKATKVELELRCNGVGIKVYIGSSLVKTLLQRGYIHIFSNAKPILILSFSNAR